MDAWCIYKCPYYSVYFSLNWGNRMMGLVSLKHLLFSLRWRHNGCDSVSNHQPRDCLLSRLFRRRSKKTWKLRVTGLCVGNSPGPRTKGQLRGKCFHLMTSSCASDVLCHSLWWRRTLQWRHNEWSFAQPLVQAQIQENIKASRHWPLWRECTGDRWIPLTKGQ